MSPLKKLFSTPYPYLFLLGYYGVWLLWDGLRIPFSNPQGIISSVTTIGYNPASNVLRFIASVAVPPLVCLLYWLLVNQKWLAELKKNIWLRRLFLASLIILPLLLSLCMGIVQSSTRLDTNQINGSYGGPYKYSLVDTFHEGETLGMAQSYQDSTQKPYRDFVFVHGVFQDPIRTILAFKLFGRSIGASRAFASILTIFTFALYYVLLLVLFKKNLLKAALGMAVMGLVLVPPYTLPIIYPYLVGIQLPFRDIATILFLIAAVLGFRSIKPNNTRKLLFWSSIIGFISIAGFANSIDRAFYILALSILWLFLIYFMIAKKDFIKTPLLGYLIGFILGTPLLGLALKWDFKDFLSFLISISSNKEFLDGIKFVRPDGQVSIVLITLGVMITAIGAVFIQQLSKRPAKLSKKDFFFKSMRTFISKYHLQILLGATAIVFMRSAIGRASIDHFNYSVTWMYLLFTVLLVEILFSTKNRATLTGFVTSFLLLFVTGQYVVQAKKIDIRHDTFPIHIKDKDLVRTDHLETAEFLKKNLDDNESFVTLTSEATWYYLAEKPSPVKYPIVWFAYIPEERQELALQIKENENIKYIVTNNNWTTNFDFVPNSQRFPEVYEVLQNYYVPARGFGQQTVWQRTPNLVQKQDSY